MFYRTILPFRSRSTSPQTRFLPSSRFVTYNVVTSDMGHMVVPPFSPKSPKIDNRLVTIWTQCGKNDMMN